MLTDPGFRVVGRPALGVPAEPDEAWPALLLYRPGGSFVMLDYELSVRPDFAEICVDLPGGAGHACCFARRLHPYRGVDRGPRAVLDGWNAGRRLDLVGWLGRTRDDCHQATVDDDPRAPETVRLEREGEPLTAGAVAAGAGTSVEGYRLPDGGRIRVDWSEVATPLELDLLVPAFIGDGYSWTELADWMIAYGSYGDREYNDYRATVGSPVVVDPERAARIVVLGACS